MSLNYVVLTLDLYDGQGNPVTKGTATFTPSAQLTDTTDHELIIQQPVVASFPAGGLPTVKLLATDNGSPLPAGWGWSVAFAGMPSVPPSFSFFLPFASGSAQYLSAQAPVSSVVTMTAYAPLASPALTGTPTVPTQAAGDNSTKAASTAYVATAVAARVVSGQFLATSSYAPASQTTQTVTTTTMAAFASTLINTGAFTAPPSGSVLVSCFFVGRTSASAGQVALGLAAHGTVTPMISNVIVFRDASITTNRAYVVQFMVSGLTPGTSYTLDLLGAATSGDTWAIYAWGQSTTTPSLTGSAANEGAPVVMTVQAI